MGGNRIDVTSHCCPTEANGRTRMGASVPASVRCDIGWSVQNRDNICRCFSRDDARIRCTIRMLFIANVIMVVGRTGGSINGCNRDNVVDG